MPHPASQTTETGQESDDSENNKQTVAGGPTAAVDSTDSLMNQVRDAVPFPVLPVVAGFVLLFTVFLLGWKIG
jgi:hypothetical protein